MDRMRAESPVYRRQWSVTESRSPSMSPAYRMHPGGVGSFSLVNRTKNVATKAAARRLAKAMASQNKDDEENDDGDHEFRFAAPTLNSGIYDSSALSYIATNSSSGTRNLPAVSLARHNRSQSPALVRKSAHQIPSVRSASAGRSSITSTPSSPNLKLPMLSLKFPVSIPPFDPAIKDRDKRFFGVNPRDKGCYREASALRDELDMVQEENEIVLEKLRHAKEKRKEAEARARELEKQVASLGEGVSLEAKLLSRKEAALRQRETVLKNAKQKKDGEDEEIVSLRSELQILKVEAATAMKRLQEAESETKCLRTMTQRMILTQSEMEEVALKRCWLARYWGLAVQHGICGDIAPSRHEHWSALAPLPFELVISAAQKAKELAQDKDGCDKSKTDRFLSNLTGEGNIESMLSVEMGLRELTSLKVEDAVVLAFSQQRTPSLVRQDSKGRGELRVVEEYELGKEQEEDVAFKQAWLIYFWGRAKLHNVETDIADERFHFWISRTEQQSSTSHDAVDVEQGLIELRKLGIEQQLWEACRKETNQFSSSSSPTS